MVICYASYLLSYKDSLVIDSYGVRFLSLENTYQWNGKQKIVGIHNCWMLTNFLYLVA